jgi:hypothetical protein
VPEGADPGDIARGLFSSYLDSSRRLILVGTKKTIPTRAYVGTRSGAEYFLDIGADGVGSFQPIFHIDMFISLVGLKPDGRFELLVGSPSLGDTVLGTKSPFALDDVYDRISDSLQSEGFAVTRNPLVHRPSIGETFSFVQLKEYAAQPGYEALGSAVKELGMAGAADATLVRIRTWHHVTWNNCLVEDSVAHGKHVYLPTFGWGTNADLKPIDLEMKALWEGLGFTVHLLGDFNRFAERQGVVHCIKKYIARGN